jgi:hypothetical protein
MAQVVLTEVQAGNPFTSASEAAFEDSAISVF